MDSVMRYLRENYCKKLLTCYYLGFHITSIVISRNEYLEIPWACLRGMVEPTFGERSLIQHKDYLRSCRVIVSNVVDISDSQVITSEGQLVPYDYLVIATRHGDQLPKTRAERLKQYQADYEKIKAAQSVLIVGGGPTGVQLAGEIAVDFLEKKITLVHKGERLLGFLGPKASKKTLDWLTSKHIEVKLEQTVNLEDVADGSRLLKTSACEIIRADCHFWCIGKPSASLWLRDTILRNSMDANDITNIKEMKHGYLAKKQASVVTKNLKWLLGGGNESEMVSTYKLSAAKATVTLGSQSLVAQSPLNTMMGRIPGLITSKDLFVGKMRNELDVDSHVVHYQE
uniref:Apoptosis-inducing factor homolog B n=1 Tax=Tanacetum cinerariifolium TaxID=118510 RepID=A0A699HCI2_TANCI|nr:apoptosis-inducing factor homolog B [Tanacetum cinerariifolium]